MTVTSAACPACATDTVAIGRRQPWCPACDWNTDQSTPVVFGLRWIDRPLHRVAARLTEAQFAALAGGPLTPRGMTAARFATLAAAVLSMAGVLAIAAFGVWLLFYHFFGFATVLGALLIGVAVVLRPRLPGSPTSPSGAAPSSRAGRRI